eukprot:gene2183-1594_t
MWLADHGKQIGVEGGISASDALNIELLAKLDHSLRQAAFEYEQHLEDMSYTSNAQVSSEQQITYITKITTSAMEVFDRLIQEIGETFPLLKTLKRALLPSIFVRHVGGTVPERDEASVTSAGAAGSSSSVNNGVLASSPTDATPQPLIVERWIRGEESLHHLSSVHEGLTKDFARLNHELHECKELLAEQEAKCQSMARAQVKTFDDLRESNQERLKYMSDCKMIREELDMVQEQLRGATDAKVTAEYKTSNLEFQVKEQLGQIETLERKISDQSAVMEKFKKELNDLKKERREVKKDLFDVQDKLKHLRHTLIHDRKEVLESFEQTKQKARQACVAVGLMDADEEDNATADAQAVTDANAPNGGDGDGDRAAGSATTVAIAARPKTTEELKQAEDDLLDLEFTDRAWQMGSYQHSRRIEIELTNACTLGREQADALLMLQEDHRADLKVLRRDEAIRRLTATLETCQTTLEATTRDLVEAKKKLEQEESAALVLKLQWEAKYRDDLLAQEARFTAKLDAKQLEKEGEQEKLRMTTEELRHRLIQRADQQKKVLDLEFQAQRYKMVIQMKENEVDNLQKHIAEVEDMCMAAQATIEELVAEQEYVTTTVQTDEMGDMFAMVAAKYKSVTISAQNSPEAWEYLSVRMHLEHDKIQAIMQFFQRERKAIEQELQRLREANDALIAQIPGIINGHIEQLAASRMMAMVKEEAERRMREVAEQQIPAKLQTVDVGLLYKLTQKIKKTLEVRRTPLPSTLSFKAALIDADDYENIEDEDEDAFDSSKIVNAQNTQPKRLTDIDVEPFHPGKLERRTVLRRYTTARFYNRGTQTWDHDATVSSRFHHHLLERGGSFAADKANVLFPHRAHADEDYTKQLLAMSPKQLSQPFVGYIRMHEKQYAREVGLMKVALRECRGLYERLLRSIRESMVTATASAASADEAKLQQTPWTALESTVREYEWIFDPKALQSQRSVSSRKGQKKAKRKSRGGLSLAQASFLSFSPLPGHMDPIDINAQARMISSYRQALERERACIAAGDGQTRDGTDRQLIVHAIEDLIVDLHTRMELHGGWQALLYRADGSVDYDMDISAFTPDEQRDILLEQKKLLRVQLQTQHERALKTQASLQFELQRLQKQEQRRAMRRGASSGHLHTAGGDGEEADVGVQTLPTWHGLQATTYAQLLTTLGTVIDTLRFCASSAGPATSTAAVANGAGAGHAVVPYDATAAAASTAPLALRAVGGATTTAAPSSLPPLKRASHRPKTAAPARGGPSPAAETTSEYVSFVQRKPLQLAPSASASWDASQVSASQSLTTTPVLALRKATAAVPTKKQRPWSSSQWRAVQTGVRDSLHPPHPSAAAAGSASLLSASMSSLPVAIGGGSGGVGAASLDDSGGGGGLLLAHSASWASASLDDLVPLLIAASSGGGSVANAASLVVEGAGSQLLDRRSCLNESALAIYEQVLERQRQDEFRRQLARDAAQREQRERATAALVTDEIRALYEPGDRIVVAATPATTTATNDASTATTATSDFVRAPLASSPMAASVGGGGGGFFAFPFDRAVDFAQDPWQLRYQLATAHALCAEVFARFAQPSAAQRHGGSGSSSAGGGEVGVRAPSAMQFTDSLLTSEKSQDDASDDRIDAGGGGGGGGHEAATDDALQTLTIGEAGLDDAVGQGTAHASSAAAAAAAAVAATASVARHVHFSAPPRAVDCGTDPMPPALDAADDAHGDVDDRPLETRASSYATILRDTWHDASATVAAASSSSTSSAAMATTLAAGGAVKKPLSARPPRAPNTAAPAPFSTDLVHHAMQLHDAIERHSQALRQCETRLQQLQQSHGHLGDVQRFLAAAGLMTMMAASSSVAAGRPTAAVLGDRAGHAREHYANTLLYQRLATHFGLTLPRRHSTFAIQALANTTLLAPADPAAGGVAATPSVLSSGGGGSVATAGGKRRPTTASAVRQSSSGDSDGATSDAQQPPSLRALRPQSSTLQRSRGPSPVTAPSPLLPSGDVSGEATPTAAAAESRLRRSLSLARGASAKMALPSPGKASATGGAAGKRRATTAASTPAAVSPTSPPVRAALPLATRSGSGSTVASQPPPQSRNAVGVAAREAPDSGKLQDYTFVQ